MAVLQFNCPLCAALFQIDGLATGQQVACPTCQGIVNIPATPPEAPPVSGPPAAQPAISQLACPVCAGVFQVSSEMAGQVVACPHCDGQVAIPDDPTSPPVPPPAAAPGPPISSAVASAKSTRQQFFPPGYEPPATAEKTEPSRATRADKNATESGSAKPVSSMYPPGFEPPTDQPKDDQLAPAAKPTKAAKSKRAEQATPAVDAMLPPGAATSPLGSATQPAMVSADSAADTLLPPGSTGERSRGESTRPRSRSSQADELLPPGAAGDTLQQQVALPTTRKQETDPFPAARSSKTASSEVEIRTDDGAVVRLHEPVRTVGEGAEQRELHTLSPEQKARRRMIRSIVMWSFCAIVLAVTLTVLIVMSS